MGARNKKKLKTLNLLKMSSHQRSRLIKKVRKKLQQRITEAKLWQSLLEAENLTINGNVVYESNQTLNGFSQGEIWKYR